jgi:hypothetical protein
MPWPTHPTEGDVYSPDDGLTLYKWNGEMWVKLSTEERLRRLESRS